MGNGLLARIYFAKSQIEVSKKSHESDAESWANSKYGFLFHPDLTMIRGKLEKKFPHFDESILTKVAIRAQLISA